MSENQISQKTKEEWLEQGIALLKAQKYREALNACDCASQLDSTCPRAYHGMGLIYTQIKDYRKAFDAYEHALQLAPYNAKIAFDIGVLYFITGIINVAMYIVKKLSNLILNTSIFIMLQ